VLTAQLGALIRRKRAEEALRESQERFVMAGRATNDVLWDVDLLTREVRFTDTVHRMYGHTEMRASFAWRSEQTHPDDRARVEDGLKTAILRGDQVWADEYRFRRADGGYEHVFDRCYILRDAQARPVRLIGSMMNITDRKEAEEQQARLMAELESANRDLNDFAYVVSHDLKAPLRAIGSLASWIAADYAERLDDAGREQLRLLTSRVLRMNDLIEGILSYSRAGRVRDERTHVELERVLPEIVDSLAPPAHINVEIGALPAIVYGRTAIRQVFQNLIHNAVKFTDKPSGRVTVSCVTGGEVHTFCVADEGPGIDAKHFERIFLLFQTLAPRDRIEGTGVGLAVVKKLVELHGGRVWLASELGRGSRFYFTVPRESAPA
jgi:PAS domain S-box-containing protein